MEKVNIAEKFAKISEYWKPYIAAELNGQLVKLDKLKGEFVFHHHENEDEMFLVTKGRFRMEFRDRHEWIEEGECIVVPRGVEHKPVAAEECWILRFRQARYPAIRDRWRMGAALRARARISSRGNGETAGSRETLTSGKSSAFRSLERSVPTCQSPIPARTSCTSSSVP